jgi:hypothetical protein
MMVVVMLSVVGVRFLITRVKRGAINKKRRKKGKRQKPVQHFVTLSHHLQTWSRDADCT